MKYKQSIGVLGGMGSYATLYLFERLLDAFPAEKEWDRPRILVDNNCTMPSRVRAILYGEDKDRLISEMSDSINQLVNSGADKIVIGCVTAHSFLEELPHKDKIINILDETAQNVLPGEIVVLCTEGSIQTGIWTQALKQCNVIYPDEQQLVQLRDFIEIVKQRKITEESLKDFSNYVNGFECKQIIMGCTELPALLDDNFSDKKIIDPIKYVIERIKREMK